jgi:hypothetical protein
MVDVPPAFWLCFFADVTVIAVFVIVQEAIGNTSRKCIEKVTKMSKIMASNI